MNQVNSIGSLSSFWSVLAVCLLWGCSDPLTEREIERIGDGLPPPLDQATDRGPGDPPAEDMGPMREDQGDDPPVDLLENQVSIQTSMGQFTIELDFDAAPLSSRNFLNYVEGGFYDGSDSNNATVFHFVDPEFSIAAGGFDEAGMIKPVGEPILHEENNGLLNVRGAVALSRNLQLPVSATSQFFVNVVDNPEIDYLDERRTGYAVFARVVQGMEVVDAIAAAPSDENGAPIIPVVIQQVQRWR